MSLNYLYLFSDLNMSAKLFKYFSYKRALSITPETSVNLDTYLNCPKRGAIAPGTSFNLYRPEHVVKLLSHNRTNERDYYYGLSNIDKPKYVLKLLFFSLFAYAKSVHGTLRSPHPLFLMKFIFSMHIKLISSRIKQFLIILG